MNLMKKLMPSLKSGIHAIFEWFSPQIAVSVPYEIRIASGEELAGQVAAVTGGSGVIGRSIACYLAAEGATVYVGGMSQRKIDAVVAEINELGGMAHPMRLDVTDETKITQFFSEILERHGRLDILVNTAGGSAREDCSALMIQKTSVIDQVLSINLRGAILCCREAARIMSRSGYGRIINISSILGVQGKANYSEYAASKGGVIAFTKSIAMELGPSGITANCVSPGIVQRDAISPGRMGQLSHTNWLDGYGKPEDIAAMVVYLASDQASFITGQNFIVDGGRSIGLKGD